MFTVEFAGIDVADLIIGSPIVITTSSDFPFFGDAEISNVTFQIVSEDSEFDPLKSGNWFETNWGRVIDANTDAEWNRTGLRCPVVMKWTENSVETVMFNGVIVDITPDIATESATIQCTDASYQLRETEMELTDFGVSRYISVGNPDNENVYRLPPTAARINPQTVKARHANSTLTDDELMRVDELEFANRDKCHLSDNDIRFIVIPNTPAIQTDRELTDSPVSVSFKEPHRWVRLDAIAEKIVKSADVAIRGANVTPGADGNEIETDIPDFYFNTEKMEYASRGRVGWHVEHTTGSIAGGGANHHWGWTGFVRDFVVDEATGDAFFLYGHSRFPNLTSLIHYDYENDAYSRHYLPSALAGQNGQSLWRIATVDFNTFFVLSTAFDTFAGYEFGHNYNTQSSQATNANKPQILKWVKADKDNPLYGWSSSVVRDAASGQPPQLANYVNTLNNAGGGVNHWWADTRMFFDKVGDRIAYRYQKGSQQGIQLFNASNPNTIYFRQVGVSPKNGLTSEFCSDETGNTVYALTIISTGHLNIRALNLSSGNFAPETITGNNFVPPDSSTDKNLSVSDAVLHRHGTNIDIYCVIQYERESPHLPGASLVRLRKSQGGTQWTLTSLISYDYYVSSASGGVVAGDKVYYFEGNTELYGNRGPRSGLNTRQKCPGSVVEVSTGSPKYEGLSWVSAYADPDEGLNYDYGAHTGIVAPLRWDGERLHMITGYGDVAKSQAFDFNLTQAYTESDLIENPQEDINNWQWLTLGRKQPLYIEKVNTSEKVRAWDLLKRLAEIAHAQLYYNGKTLHIKPRAVFEVENSNPKTYVLDEDLEKASATRVADDYVNIIEADNYTADDNLMSLSADPTFTQTHNQIRGNINYTVRGALPELGDDREILADDETSVKYIGPKPLDLDVSLLSHHQLWWAKVIGARYIKQLSTVKYEFELRLTLLPEARIGDIIRLDVQSPALQGSGFTWATTHLNNVDTEIVEVEHTIDVDGDTAWTTKVVCRTLITEDVTTLQQSGLQADEVVEPEAIAASGTGNPATIFVCDNLHKKALKYTDIDTRAPTTDDIQLPGVDIQDATLTNTHLVVLDKAGATDHLRFYNLPGNSNIAAVDLDYGRQQGEPRGDWRGVAYNPINSKIYVMNEFGSLRTYSTQGVQDPSESVYLEGLGLDGTWRAIEFLVEGSLVTLLTLADRLPTVLAWELPLASGAALFREKFVEMDASVTHYTGIATANPNSNATGEDTVYACRSLKDLFLAYETRLAEIQVSGPPTEHFSDRRGYYLGDGNWNYLGGTV